MTRVQSPIRSHPLLMPGHLPVVAGKDIPFIPEVSHASVLIDILLEKRTRDCTFLDWIYDLIV